MSFVKNFGWHVNEMEILLFFFLQHHLLELLITVILKESGHGAKKNAVIVDMRFLRLLANTGFQVFDIPN